MGFTVNFMENQNVDAAALNEVGVNITAETQQSPYPTFLAGTVYGVDALNGISAALISKGVSNGCNVSCTKTEVKISSGVAFFADGRRITIDDEGILLTRTEGEKNYVWLLNDKISGVVSAKCTTEAPSGDYVFLAEISENGSVTEKQDKALMKNASCLPNSYTVIDLTASVDKVTTEYTYNLSGDYKRMVLIGDRGIYFYDWETNTAYKGEGSKQDIIYSPSDLKIYYGYSLITLKSCENNVLTYTSRVSPNYSSGTSRKCKVFCM